MKHQIQQFLSESEDLRKVHELIMETSLWLRSKGIQQWENPVSLDDLKAAAAKGEVFGVKVEGEVVAAVTLTQEKDSYWGSEKGKALYLHRLVVSRSYKGKGLGSELLEWSERYTKEQGYTYLRLDCRESNPRLKEYYLAKGFTFKGIGTGNFSYCLFEKLL